MSAEVTKAARRLLEAVDRSSPEPFEGRSDFHEALDGLRLAVALEDPEKPKHCPIHMLSEWRDGACGACPPR